MATHASIRRSAWLLGIALGGFFDGILLHQVLQWHHLLSAVQAIDDLRMQMLADGLFHALMYLIALIALIMLWRSREGLSASGMTGRLLGWTLTGFGVWHVLDALLSHWLIGIHRIRMDAAHPLLWDVSWLAVFGLLPLLLGWRLARSQGGGDAHATGVALGVATLAAASASLIPASDGEQVIVVFRPGVQGGAAFNALAQAQARVLWADRSGGLWAVRLDQPGAAWQLYRSGALLVGNAGSGFGCISWTRAAI